MKWEALRLVQKRKHGRAVTPRVVASPVLSMHFYLPFLVEGAAKAVSQAGNLFIDFAGDTLRQYWAQSYYQPTTAKGVRRMLANLAKKGFGLIDADGGEDHAPGDCGVFVQVAHRNHRHEAAYTDSVRLDLPVRYGARECVEDVVSLYKKLLGLLPFETSHCGFGFKTLAGSSNSGHSEICRRLMTYRGLDPGYQPAAQKMAGRTYSAHWLNAVNTPMAEALGGRRALKGLSADVAVTQLNDGVLLRSMETPPVGQLIKGQRQIGAMPEVARYLRPRRSPIKSLGGTLDAQVWLARFDTNDE